MTVPVLVRVLQISIFTNHVERYTDDSDIHKSRNPTSCYSNGDRDPSGSVHFCNFASKRFVSDVHSLSNVSFCLVWDGPHKELQRFTEPVSALGHVRRTGPPPCTRNTVNSLHCVICPSACVGLNIPLRSISKSQPI